MMDFEKIGKYQIVGKIGQGAMGEVFKAHDPLLNRLIAVKTISGASPAEGDARKRFLREAQSAARLNHPNIITVYDLGEEHGRVYMAMELLEGTDLREIINTHAVTDIGQKLDFIEQVCDGLAYAHTKQIVHRDLKPGNIHVQPSGQVKIMDFGLARLGASEMTATGTVMGTPNYMSPEQVRGEKADARSDIFSLGAVFYELLTAHKAFDADSIHAVLFQVLEHDPEPVRHWAADVPEILVEIVHRALEKDPARRFQDGQQMRDALRIARLVFTGDMDEEAGLTALQELGSADATVIGLAAAGDAATIITSDPTVAGPDVSADRTRTRKAASLLKGRSLSRTPGSSRGSRTGTARPSSRAPVPPAPRPGRASRVPVMLGAGVLALVVVAGVAAWLLRPAPVAPTPTPNATDPLMVDALVASLVELANQDLKNKNYASAVKRADSILSLRKDNAEARDIRGLAQGKLEELKAGAQEARRAFEAGDTDKASQALATVMSIDPNDPVVDELSQKLNRYFQTKAEDARSEMTKSRSLAEGAGAIHQPDFADAADGARKAEALFKNREFAVATGRYLEARDRFERARNNQVRPTPAPRPTPVFIPPTPVPVPPTLPAPAPTTVVPTFAPGPVTPPSAPPTISALGDEPAIRKVMDDYKRAIEASSVELFRAVKPNLSSREEQSLRESFKAVRNHQVNLALGPIQIAGSQATVRVSRQDVLDGRRATFQQTFTLVKGPGGWVIKEIGQ
jgi:serine/threonine protein kinase/tetratricopeptide (TPR) repeat protein